MKAFYRMISLLCVFLVIFVLFSGIAGADDRSFANENAVSAPSTIKAGEIANMTIKVPVPENATATYGEGPEIPEEGHLVDIHEIIVSNTFGTDGKPVKFEFPRNATDSQ